MKREMKPGNLLYPLPAALVSCIDKNGQTNLITIGWTGTICSDPPMVYISVRPERYSHHMLMETKEFVINLTNEDTIRATDFCGVKSGRDVNKWEACHLTPEKAKEVAAPLVSECPVNIECKVTEVISLGTHDMFMAKVVAVHGDEAYFNAKGTFELEKAKLVAYTHGTYQSLGETIGTFGYSVRKKAMKAPKAATKPKQTVKTPKPKKTVKAPKGATKPKLTPAKVVKAKKAAGRKATEK